MARWQVQEAKQRFSELLREARDDGPQIVTRHGEEIAVVIDMRSYRRLRGEDLGFKDFLRSGPLTDELEIHRSTEPTRSVGLDL
jgi:prevent-host-death family protein